MRLFVLALVIAIAAPAAAPAAPAAKPASLGSIRFDVTGGKPAARAQFLQGVLALHSFFYEEAHARFDQAIQLDPTFTMAHWGKAFAHAKLLWMDDNVPAAREALARLPGVDKVTPRERAWIDAVRVLFGEGEPPARRVAFAAAMEKLHLAYPDDDEARAFYAIALIATTIGDESHDRPILVKAASLAMDVRERNPMHPGAAHYIIHALDRPDLAPLALPAARAYARIAPEAFHARHMPAHIFVRLGMWQEALASCQSAWDASVVWQQKGKRPVEQRDLHSLHWIVVMKLELGRKKDAAGALALMADAVRAGMPHGTRSHFVQVVGEYLGRTEEWSRVDELLAPLASAATPDRGPDGRVLTAAELAQWPPGADLERMAVAMLRAQAAAERKDLPALKRHLADAEAIRKVLDPYVVKLTPPPMVPIMREMNKLGREGMLARARRDPKAGIANLRKMLAYEEKMGGSPGERMGGGPRQALANALLEQKKAKEALVEAEAVLAEHPNLGAALYTAAKAARDSGDAPRARSYFEKLQLLLAQADSDYGPLAEAKQALGAR
jgi:tetratricopeptide (TPR) repeat protein